MTLDGLAGLDSGRFMQIYTSASIFMQDARDLLQPHAAPGQSCIYLGIHMNL